MHCGVGGHGQTAAGGYVGSVYAQGGVYSMVRLGAVLLQPITSTEFHNTVAITTVPGSVAAVIARFGATFLVPKEVVTW